MRISEASVPPGLCQLPKITQVDQPPYARLLLKHGVQMASLGSTPTTMLLSSRSRRVRPKPRVGHNENHFDFAGHTVDLPSGIRVGCRRGVAQAWQLTQQQR